MQTLKCAGSFIHKLQTVVLPWVHSLQVSRVSAQVVKQRQYQLLLKALFTKMSIQQPASEDRGNVLLVQRDLSVVQHSKDNVSLQKKDRTALLVVSLQKQLGFFCCCYLLLAQGSLAVMQMYQMHSVNLPTDIVLTGLRGQGEIMHTHSSCCLLHLE